MFAGIFNRLLEPFTSKYSFDYTKEPNKSQEELRYYYGEKLPNAVLSGNDRSIPLTKATTTYMGDTNNKKIALDDRYLLPNNSLTKDLFTQRQAACEGSRGDPFAHLSQLADSFDPKSRFRCGWVYNSTTPSAGRGAYGSMDGPIETTAQGTWMWDLNAAKKKYHMAICKSITTCDDLNNTMYKGKCGFCKATSRGIPISGSGAAYPYDPLGACSSSNIVTTAGSCPKPAPPPPPGSPAAAEYMATRQTCDPLPGGKYPRDCYIQKAQQAGCSDNGTLITALKAGSDTNYLDTLMQAAAYSTYQQRAATGINETYMKTGRATVADALNDFTKLQDNAASAANQGLKAAAVDLCFTKGSFEQYDFCTELQPTTPVGQVSLDCLQAEFRRQGGQETGDLYPSAATLSTWNAMASWLDVQNFITDLGKKTQSPDRKIQSKAASQFYGITFDRTLAPLGDITNVEIFWFTPDPDVKNGSTTFNTTFLGRRIRSQIPRLNGDAKTQSSFVYFTNVKVSSEMKANIRFTGDAGFIFLKNGIIKNTYSGNGADNTDSELSSLYPSFGNPQSQMGTSNPWTFNMGPNIITGYYIGNGKNYNLQYYPLPDANIPAFCGCLGKPSGDGEIRVYTEDECALLNGNWFSNGECLVKTERGSYSAMCAPLNNKTSCVSSWSQFPPNMLHLIQHPYAPMIKFAARPNHINYGCDYSFCDKRLGSHKMKFKVYGSNGATLNPVPDIVGAQPAAYSLDKSFMRFANGSGMNSMFLLKMYSFMTMVFKINITAMPSRGQTSSLCTFWGGASGDFPALFITGLGSKSARVGCGSAFNTTTSQGSPTAYGIIPPGMSRDGPTIVENQTYLITLKALRSSEGDPSTLTSLQVGAALVSDLQNDPTTLKESTAVTWPNKSHLEDPNSNNSRMMFINPSMTGWPGSPLSPCEFNLFSIEMYDYILAGDNLQHAANMDWPQGPQGPNPYN